MTGPLEKDAALAALADAGRDGRIADAVTIAVDLLARHPICPPAWRALFTLPLLDAADALGIAHWLPLTHSRAPLIVNGLLRELRAGFHAGKLVALCEMSRRCGIGLPHEQLTEVAGVPVFARPIRIPPQDVPSDTVLWVHDHDVQPWVHTHNRPDHNRKPQHPFAPFVHVPGLQIERTRAPDKPECSFTLFDASHAPLLQDTMWSGLLTTPKLLICPTVRTAVTFGWVPHATIPTPVVFLPNRDNYYHFLMETLPAAVQATRQPATAGHRLLFSRLSPWQREALTMAGVPLDEAYELENIRPSGTDPDHFHFADAWAPVDLPFAVACAIVRDALPVQRKMRRGERLFITRSGGGHVVRRLENEDAVMAALAARGFTPVIAEHLSFREQVERFAAAEMVAGAHGAGLTNMIHAPQQATLIELINASCHNEQAMNFSSMQRITQCNGQNYIRVIGAEPPGIGAEVFPPNRPYTVEIDDVLRAVDTAEQNYRHTVYPG